MRTSFALVIFLLCLNAKSYCQVNPYANTPEYRQGEEANQRWHWFESGTDTYDRILSRPGWTVSDVTEKGDNKTVTFISDDKAHYLTIHLYRNTLGAITFGFPQEAPQQASFITETAEEVSEGHWEDKANNAKIVRRYTGGIILYRIDYAPLAKRSGE